MVASYKDKVAANQEKVVPPSSRPPLPADTDPPPPPSGSLGRSGSSVSVSHDLSKGSLYVDLLDEAGFAELPQTSSDSATSSSDTSPIEKGEIPPDEEDDFIEFFSKRRKKREKATARARGPLTL